MAISEPPRRTPPPGSEPVVVLGGGFAGLACATALAEGGARVTVLEKKPHLGGRARSFRDPRTGETVDNGQHLFLGCYRQALAFLRRIGTEALLRFPPGVLVPYADAQGGRDALRCPAWLPSPLHLAYGVWGLSGLSWGDKLGLLRLDWHYARQELRPRGSVVGGRGSGEDPSRELDRSSVRRWLDSMGLSRRLQGRLLDPIAIGALNELPEKASALGLAQVLREAFYRNAGSSRLGFPGVGLSELYVDPARRFIEERGGQVRLSCAAAALLERGGRLDEVVTERGERFSASAVVSTLPPWALDRLQRPRALRGSESSWKASPIVGINLWMDRTVLSEPFIGLLDTEVHWVFNKTALWRRNGGGQYLSLVISGAHRRVASSPPELLGLAGRDLSRCFPEFKKAKITAWSVVKEPYATPSPACGMDALRPGPRSGLPNFFYAGDWTQTGLPATLESAAAGGHACAELVLEGARA